MQIAMAITMQVVWVRGCVAVLLIALALAPPLATGNVPNAAVEFDSVDTNDDRRVSSSEFEVFTRRIFDEMDSNADDKLTTAEVMASEAKFNRYIFTTGAILGPAELTTAERMQRIDVNRDGLVSQGEHANAAALKFQDMDRDDNGELGLVEYWPGG